MELIVNGSFYRDLANFSNRNLLTEVYAVILEIESANTISRIKNLKKLERYDVQYRIKVANDYRIGVVIRENKIWLVRFGHRSIFYKKFP